MRQAVAVFVLCGLALAACSHESADSVTTERDARVVTDVVARVRELTDEQQVPILVGKL